MSGTAPQPVAESRSTVVRLMVPTDANFAGNVFGGVILSELDRVAYATATRHCRRNCVTASIDRVDFLAPVHVGDVVEWEAELTYVGRTSMEVWIRVTAEGLQVRDRRPVGEAYVMMVAVDDRGHPTPVPPLDLVSAEERNRFEAGRARAESRVRDRRAVSAAGPSGSGEP